MGRGDRKCPSSCPNYPVALHITESLGVKLAQAAVPKGIAWGKYINQDINHKTAGAIDAACVNKR